MVTDPILMLLNVKRHFRQGSGELLEVLRGVHMTLYPGEAVALIGPSGVGKSTLLHIAGLLEPVDEGEVRIAGNEKAHVLSDARRASLRCGYVGFVYQYHHLLPEFSALENVMIPQMIAGVHYRQAEIRARSLLDRMDLTNRAEHFPQQLSGGEQQRVAIARALANHPKVLLADEPTGSLDPITSARVLAELLRLVREETLATLVVTHNVELTRHMDRVIELNDGYLRSYEGNLP